jgi:hypothetical protein
VVNADQPAPPGAAGPAAPPPPPGSPTPTEGLAVAAIVLAVVSLFVPVVPGIAALVAAATAARRIRRAPAGAAGGRGLATAALVLATIGLVAWGGLGALALVTHPQEPAGWQAATGAATGGADRFSEVTAPPATELPATEPPATAPPVTPPKVGSGRVGDRLTVYETGAAVLEVTVTRVRFSTGDQFEQPQHGLFLGAHMTVRALADEQDTPFGDSYALVGRHRYNEWLIEVNGFAPYLDPATLNQGEQVSGWLVFDVPARHGQLVVRDSLNERTIGTWKF